MSSLNLGPSRRRVIATFIIAHLVFAATIAMVWVVVPSEYRVKAVPYAAILGAFLFSVTILISLW